MRKKTVDYILDNIFWLILSFMPVLGYLIYIFALGQNPNLFATSGTLPSGTFSFYSFMANLGIVQSSSNPIANALHAVFGSTGIIPLFQNNSFVVFFTYFINIQIIHLIIDILLFIVRLAHKWMNKAIQGD